MYGVLFIPIALSLAQNITMNAHKGGIQMVVEKIVYVLRNGEAGMAKYVHFIAQRFVTYTKYFVLEQEIH